MTERSKNVLLLVVSLLICIPLVELAFRIAYDEKIFHVEDYRFTRAVRDRTWAARYDSLLGWVMKPNLNQGSRVMHLGTKDHGIRIAGPGDTEVNTGSVLVVGSSFGAGSEVTDEDAFPAQLGTLLGAPVENGSVGGFGTDQIVLRTEQLLPIVKPKTLILDIALGNISISTYSVAGRPKPYFTLEDGALVHRNNPVPTHEPARTHLHSVRNLLGYSFAIDRMMVALLPNVWYSEDGKTVIGTGQDGVAITCRLLGRVAAYAHKSGIRTVLSVQYGGSEVVSWPRQPIEIRLVQECAQKLGYEVVDEFDILKALSKSDLQEFRRNYVMHPGTVYGHKSKPGNLMVAKRLQAQLDKAPLERNPATPPDVAGPALIPGDGQNLLAGTEALDQYTSWIAQVKPGGVSNNIKTFRITAGGAMSEHYAGLSSSTASSGPFTFSIEARMITTPHLALTVVDANNSGVQTGFDLQMRTSSARRLGEAREIGNKIVSLGGGWYRISTTVTLSDPKTIYCYIKIMSKTGLGQYIPNGEVIEVRAVQLERGQTVSPYKPAARIN